MEEDKMFDLMTKMYSEMQTGFSNVNDRLDRVESRLDRVETRLDSVEIRLGSVENKLGKIEIDIENTIKPNIKLLVEGHVTHTSQLDRIEAEVTLHDEIIFKRAK